MGHLVLQIPEEKPSGFAPAFLQMFLGCLLVVSFRCCIISDSGVFTLRCSSDSALVTMLEGRVLPLSMKLCVKNHYSTTTSVV
jgi:hypothetical protein